MVYNELLMPFQADILDPPFMRPKVAETPSLGAAFAAGLSVDFWDNLVDQRANWQVDKIWDPQLDLETRGCLYSCIKVGSRRLSGPLID